MTATTILSLLADPNVLTILVSLVASVIAFLAGGHGKVSASPAVRALWTSLGPAVEHTVQEQAKQQSHGFLQGLAAFSRNFVGELAHPSVPPAAGPPRMRPPMPTPPAPPAAAPQP
jgi:hypothetical protein